jgi:hypothetical protein
MAAKKISGNIGGIGKGKELCPGGGFRGEDHFAVLGFLRM